MIHIIKYILNKMRIICKLRTSLWGKNCILFYNINLIIEIVILLNKVHQALINKPLLMLISLICMSNSKQLQFKCIKNPRVEQIKFYKNGMSYFGYFYLYLLWF